MTTTRQGNSFARSPEVYCLSSDSALLETMVVELDEEGWSVRGFSDADLLAQEFATAKPRPALLIAGIVDLGDSGCRAVRKCREVLEELRVIVFAAEPIEDAKRWCAIRQLDYDAAVLVPAGDSEFRFHDFDNLFVATDSLLREASVEPVAVVPTHAQMREMRLWNPWRIDAMATISPPWARPQHLWPEEEARDASMRSWGRWFLSVSRISRKAHLERHPVPKEWKGAYMKIVQPCDV